MSAHFSLTRLKYRRRLEGECGLNAPTGFGGEPEQMCETARPGGRAAHEAQSPFNYLGSLPGDTGIYFVNDGNNSLMLFG